MPRWNWIYSYCHPKGQLSSTPGRSCEHKDLVVPGCSVCSVGRTKGYINSFDDWSGFGFAEQPTCCSSHDGCSTWGHLPSLPNQLGQQNEKVTQRDAVDEDDLQLLGVHALSRFQTGFCASQERAGEGPVRSFPLQHRRQLQTKGQISRRASRSDHCVDESPLQ